MAADKLRAVAKNNDEVARNHHPMIRFTEFPKEEATMVSSCMDPRANPNEFWNFGYGSPHMPAVLRNAGGRVTEDTLLSIRTLSGIMSYGENTVGAVAVVHHTDCGLRNFSNEQVATKLKEHAGLEGQRAAEVEQMDFGSWKHFDTPEESVRYDMKLLKADPYLPKDLQVLGYVHDGETGKTTEVAAL